MTVKGVVSALLFMGGIFVLTIGVLNLLTYFRARAVVNDPSAGGANLKLAGVFLAVGFAMEAVLAIWVELSY